MSDKVNHYDWGVQNSLQLKKNGTLITLTKFKEINRNINIMPQLTPKIKDL